MKTLLYFATVRAADTFSTALVHVLLYSHCTRLDSVICNVLAQPEGNSWHPGASTGSGEQWCQMPLAAYPHSRAGWIFNNFPSLVTYSFQMTHPFLWNPFLPVDPFLPDDPFFPGDPFFLPGHPFLPVPGDPCIFLPRWPIERQAFNIDSSRRGKKETQTTTCIRCS